MSRRPHWPWGIGLDKRQARRVRRRAGRAPRTELTPDERDAYAAPGTYLRACLDSGVVPWPATRDDARRELLLNDILAVGEGTLGDETLFLTVNYNEEKER